MGRVVRGAPRPGGAPPGQDRWTATTRGIAVLDGASAFDRSAPPADDYVDTLLGRFATYLDTEDDLATVIHDAIAETAERLQLDPGRGPSSTVLLLREAGERLELAVLGDSTAMIGVRDGRIERVADDRMSTVAAPVRHEYRSRLRQGCGYDATHRELLTRIQRAERDARNTPGGYWIAEATPAAGAHAIRRPYPVRARAWCVLATAGAQRGFDHHQVQWTTLHEETSHQLLQRLDDLHRWEADHDPDGTELPRAKRHDDKTVVTWSTTDPAASSRHDR